MKVIVFSQVFPPSVGGVETFVATLAAGLATATREGSGPVVDVTVATSTAAAGFNDAALPFRVVRRPGTRRLIALFRNADVVHLVGPSLWPLTLVWLLRKPTVLSHHGFQTVCPNGQLFYEPERSPCPGHFMANRHTKCLECNRHRGLAWSVRTWLNTFPRRWLAARVYANVVPTLWLGGMLALPRVSVIPHGVGQGNACHSSVVPKRVSYLGRLVTTKGVAVLLEAAAALRRNDVGFQLDIVGEGPERNALEALARRLALDGYVTFHGRLDDEAAERVLEGSIVVMPSLGGEVFGYVAAQNMMAGRPVVVSDLGSLAEVVGETGLVFPAGDAQALAACLVRLLSSPHAAMQHGKRAHERAQNLFDARRMIVEQLQVCLDAERGSEKRSGQQG